VCEIVTGSTPGTQNPELWNGNIKWVTPAEITDTSYFINDTERHISPKARLKAMPAGTVLLSSRAPIGKVAIAGTPMCCNQGFKNLICSDQINNRYLYRYLKSQTAYLNSLGRGATFKEISKPIVENIHIPLPPLHVQLEIADILDQVSILLEKRKTQIDKLDMLVKSQFVEMFGDPVTNPMGWEMKSFGEFIVFLTSGSRGWSGYFTQEGEMFLTIKNVKRSSITTDKVQYVCAPKTKEAERTRVKEGDLLISITADLGRTGVISADIASYGAYINQHLSLVRLKQSKLNPLFASYYFESNAGKNQFESKNQIGVKAGLNFDAINSLVIYVPPLPLQHRFADFVRATDRSKVAMLSGLNKLELLYKSLVQKMFFASPSAASPVLPTTSKDNKLFGR
ncbi:MAG: restriction endonuclease subunit S, partial [Peptococcaceae bacterium]|nr:restriction endonuclease subunit S [Peptococcaceae bacterium]